MRFRERPPWSQRQKIDRAWAWAWETEDSFGLGLGLGLALPWAWTLVWTRVCAWVPEKIVWLPMFARVWIQKGVRELSQGSEWRPLFFRPFFFSNQKKKPGVLDIAKFDFGHGTPSPHPWSVYGLGVGIGASCSGSVHLKYKRTKLCCCFFVSCVVAFLKEHKSTGHEVNFWWSFCIFCWIA